MTAMQRLPPLTPPRRTAEGAGTLCGMPRRYLLREEEEGSKARAPAAADLNQVGDKAGDKPAGMPCLARLLRRRARR